MDPIAIIKKRCEAQSQRQLAISLGIAPGYLCDVMKGRKSPGPKLLKALGLTAQTVYKRHK